MRYVWTGVTILIVLVIIGQIAARSAAVAKATGLRYGTPGTLVPATS